ncbi:hypothetical protein SISSUDRAFT_1056202, partial [Sistotremastrum suecicum HHB10207 ss-3]
AAFGQPCVRRSCLACGDLFGTGLCGSIPTWSMSRGMARPVLRWNICGVGPTVRNLAPIPSILLLPVLRLRHSQADCKLLAAS